MTIALQTLRTDHLNIELGLDNDSDARFGSTSLRDQALQQAIHRLWPRVASFDSEVLTIEEDRIDYVSVLRDVLWLELTADGYRPQLLEDFTQWWDAGEGYQVVRLPAALPLTPAYTLTAYGYVPYTVPATTSDTTDLPTALYWVVVAGAKAFLYNQKLASFVTYERHENENRRTFLTPDQMLTMAAAAERMFQEGIRVNPRTVTRARRAVPSR